MTPASREGERRPRRSTHHGTGDHEAPACRDRLASADAALAVVLESSPRAWLATRDSPPGVEFVATYPHPDAVRTVSDPGAVTTLALAVQEWLEGLPDAATPAVCLTDPDTLLEYAGRPLTARFLQVVAARVHAAGGTVHLHDDGDAVPVSPAAAPLTRVLSDHAGRA